MTRHKWEEEEEIMFDTDEEAVIAQSIIEQVLGWERETISIKLDL